MQGMDAEAAKAAAMRAKDTQLSTLTRLLSPPQLGSGERSDSDADDAEARMQPYALQHGDDDTSAGGAAPASSSGAAAAGLPTVPETAVAEHAGHGGAGGAVADGAAQVNEQELAHAKALLASAVLPLPAVCSV